MKIFLLILLISTVVPGQVKTNLDIIYTLLDSAAQQVTSGTENIKTYSFEAGSMSRVFSSRFMSEMNSRNLVLSSSENPDLQVILEDASVTYGNMFRNGFLGPFHLSRKVQMKGNYLAGEEKSLKDFYFVYIDSISVDDIAEAENEFYPFTKGEIPPEPFFPSILEPVIAIGTTALAVLLFFTIRSK